MGFNISVTFGFSQNHKEDTILGLNCGNKKNKKDHKTNGLLHSSTTRRMEKKTAQNVYMWKRKIHLEIKLTVSKIDINVNRQKSSSCRSYKTADVDFVCPYSTDP